MKKQLFMVWPKLCTTVLLGAVALFMVSCAQDGFDENESFIPGNGVSNTKLTTPSGEDITITPSTDGSMQTISWPVVYGASAYKAVLKNATTNVVLVDSIIDNLSFATSREEDTNYSLDLQVIANTRLGNTDGEVVNKAFDTFTASYAAIPVGTDLYTYFKENALPDDVSVEYNFDLEAGGTYTMSGQLDFNYHMVTLRSKDKNNPATINIGDNANFIASNSFSLKYLNINVNVSDATVAKPFIELYKYDTDPTVLEKPKNYFMIPAVNIIGCVIKGVPGNIIYDNGMSYCIAGLTFKNTLIELKTYASEINNEAIIAFKGGGCKDFTMNNCTVYQTGESPDSKYFLRYHNSVRADRITGSKTDFTTFKYINNTFYNLATSVDATEGTRNGQWFNCSGCKDYSTYIVQNNIWVDCTQGQIARRIKGGGSLGSNSTATFLHNTYWVDGAAYSQTGHDDTGTILTTDPNFVDAANGNFTPQGAEQVQYQTGDARWFK